MNTGMEREIAKPPRSQAHPISIVATPRVPTGLCLMVSKFGLNHIIRSHMRIGHDESVPVRVSADVFWYALAYLAYMVRASLYAVVLCENLLIRQSHRSFFKPTISMLGDALTCIFSNNVSRVSGGV